MHGLETIRAINANPAAYHAANEAAAAHHKRTQPNRDEAAAQQKAHGDRVRARQIQNGPYINPQGPESIGMDGILCAIDQKPGSPFMEFWLELNTQRGVEVRYGEARALFNGGPTPTGALTFVEKGDGFRAIPAPMVNNAEGWYAEYREIADKGTKWHRVHNTNGEPINYATPTYALNAAIWAKGNAIENMLIRFTHTNPRASVSSLGKPAR